jgi:hypothetical protein
VAMPTTPAGCPLGPNSASRAHPRVLRHALRLRLGE